MLVQPVDLRFARISVPQIVMLKWIIFLCIALVLLVAGVALLFSMGQPTASTEGGPERPRVFPDAGNVVYPDDTALPFDDGGDTSTVAVEHDVLPPYSAEVREVLTEAKVEELRNMNVDLNWNDDTYMIADTDSYSIYFTVFAAYIQVRAKSILLPSTERRIEQHLSELLDATPEQLCALNIDVFASEVDDPQFTRDLGLPSCPGPNIPYQWDNVREVWLP